MKKPPMTPAQHDALIRMNIGETVLIVHRGPAGDPTHNMTDHYLWETGRTMSKVLANGLVSRGWAEIVAHGPGRLLRITDQGRRMVSRSPS